MAAGALTNQPCAYTLSRWQARSLHDAQRDNTWQEVEVTAGADEGVEREDQVEHGQRGLARAQHVAEVALARPEEDAIGGRIAHTQPQVAPLRAAAPAAQDADAQ